MNKLYTFSLLLLTTVPVTLLSVRTISPKRPIKPHSLSSRMQDHPHSRFNPLDYGIAPHSSSLKSPQETAHNINKINQFLITQYVKHNYAHINRVVIKTGYSLLKQASMAIEIHKNMNDAIDIYNKNLSLLKKIKRHVKARQHNREKIYLNFFDQATTSMFRQPKEKSKHAAQPRGIIYAKMPALLLQETLSTIKFLAKDIITKISDSIIQHSSKNTIQSASKNSIRQLSKDIISLLSAHISEEISQETLEQWSKNTIKQLLSPFSGQLSKNALKQLLTDVSEQLSQDIDQLEQRFVPVFHRTQAIQEWDDAFAVMHNVIQKHKQMGNLDPYTNTNEITNLFLHTRKKNLNDLQQETQQLKHFLQAHVAYNPECE